MAERESPGKTEQAEVARGTESIRQDIAKEAENISRTVEQISERIEEKLNWRGYVKDFPYWSLGAAVGLGYLVSGMFPKRATPMERIMGSIDEKVRDSLGVRHAATASPGLLKAALLGVATQVATGWIKNAASTIVAEGGAGPRTGRGSTIKPERGQVKK